MAVTFVAAGTTGTASGPGGVATAGLPAGLQAGDVLVFVVTTSRGAASGSAVYSSSVLWESPATRGANNGSTNTAINYHTKVWASDDPSTFTATLDGAENANTALVCYILAFRGVDHSSLTWWGGISSGSASTNAVASTTVTPPAAPLHPTDGGMAIAIVSALGNGGPYGIPASWSQAKQDETSLGPIGNSSAVFYRSYAAGVLNSDAVAVTGTTSTKAGHTITLWPEKAPEVRAGTTAKVRSASSQRGYFSISTMTCPKPVGTATGDLMIALVSVDNAGAYADITPPAGWVDGPFGSVTGSGGAGFYKSFWRYAAAGEGTSYTFGKGTSGDGVVGIVTYINASPPQRWAYFAVVPGDGTPTSADIAGQVDAALLILMLAGNGTSLRRALDPPSGMVDWVDDRPPIAAWNVLGMFSQPVTSSALVGTKASTLLSTSGSTTAPASGTTATYAGASVIIPPKGTGSLFLSGEGGLSFGAAIPGPKAGLALSGSGTLDAVAGADTPAVKGTLTLSGSGSLGLSGISRPGSSIALSGSGTLAFPTRSMTARGTLALSGGGTLLVTGGGGAGILAITASGQLAFGTAIPGPIAALARTGAGTLAFLQAAMTARGTLARTGAGTLAFPTIRVGMRGSLARTGSGQLAFVPVSMTTSLRAWDAATSTFKNVLAQAWDAVGTVWRTAAGRRASVAVPMLPVSGPVYSDGAGAAGVFSRPREFGPTGERPARMTRGPGGIGWGAYIAADIPGSMLPVPAGTWFEITWWQRSDAAGGDVVWQVINDSATDAVTGGVAYPTTAGWAKHTYKAKTLADWTPNVHRFRAGLADVPGRWLDISDARIRVWT